MATVPTCRETLDRILDAMKTFHIKNARAPVKILLPAVVAYSICKGTRDEVGDMVTALFWRGITALTEQTLYGMQVQLVRDHWVDISLE